MQPRIDIVQKHITNPVLLQEFKQAHEMGWHPLHLAAKTGDKELVKDLIKSGIPLHLQTQTAEPETAWDIALKHKRYLVLDILTECGYEFERALETTVESDPHYFNHLLREKRANHNLWMRALYRVAGFEVVPDEKERNLDNVHFPETYTSSYGFNNSRWIQKTPLFLNQKELLYLQEQLKEEEFDDLVEDIILFSAHEHDEQVVKKFYETLAQLWGHVVFQRKMDDILNLFEMQIEDEEYDGMESTVFLALYRLVKFSQTEDLLKYFVNEQLLQYEQEFLEWMAYSGDHHAFKYCLDLYITVVKQNETASLPLVVGRLCTRLLDAQAVNVQSVQYLLQLFENKEALLEFLRFDNKKRRNYPWVQKVLFDEPLFFFLLDTLDRIEQLDVLQQHLVDIIRSDMSTYAIVECLDKFKTCPERTYTVIEKMFNQDRKFFQLSSELLTELIDHLVHMRKFFEGWAANNGVEVVDQWIVQDNFIEAKKTLLLMLQLIPDDNDRKSNYDSLLDTLKTRHSLEEHKLSFLRTLTQEKNNLLDLVARQRKYYNNQFKGVTVLNVRQRVCDLQAISSVCKAGMFNLKQFEKVNRRDLLNHILSFVVENDDPRARPTHLELLTAMSTPAEVKGELRLWSNLLPKSPPKEKAAARENAEKRRRLK